MHIMFYIKLCTQLNTLRPEKNGRHSADNNFKCIFFTKRKFCNSIQIPLKCGLKGPIDSKSSLVQVMAWHQTGT